MLFNIQEDAKEPINFIAVQPRRETLIVINPMVDVQRFETNSFIKFCIRAKTPAGAMLSFIHNNVKYESSSDPNRSIYWPSDIMRNKVGNCMDFGVFMHLFFKNQGIEHALGFTSFIDKGTGKINPGHCYPVFKWYDGKYWIWNYFATRMADINGPFLSYDDVKDEAGSYFSVLFNSDSLTGPDTPKNDRIAITTIVRGKSLEIIDRAAERRERITPTALMWSLPEVQEMLKGSEPFVNATRAGLNIRRVLEIFFPIPPERGITAFFNKFARNAK